MYASKMLVHLMTPSPNGCNGLSISLSNRIVAGVKHKASVAITKKSTIKNIINFVPQFLEHSPGVAILVVELIGLPTVGNMHEQS